MTRIPGVGDAEAGRITRAVFAAAKKRVGRVPEPMRLMAHSTAVMWGNAGFELALGRARAAPARLKNLASIKAASLVGCPF